MEERRQQPLPAALAVPPALLVLLALLLLAVLAPARPTAGHNWDRSLTEQTSHVRRWGIAAWSRTSV